jgi:separase
MLEAIDGKFMEIGHDDLEWPRLESWPLALPKEESGPRSPVQHGASANLADAESDSESERTLRTYWEAVRAKYAANGFVTGLVPDLGSLPSDWAVVSISVTDDRNTMFVSRHQKGHEPIVFCLPLDRQGRREGDDDLFTFDAAVAELADIIRSSDEGARAAKSVEGPDGKAAWWANRKALDKRMEELLSNLEFCWLGAFKVSCCTTRCWIVDLKRSDNLASPQYSNAGSSERVP